MRNDVAWSAAAGGLLVGLGVAYVLREKSTPEPDYRGLASEREFEIRSYPAIMVAEAVVQGPRKQALNEGYRILSDYLTARSRPGEKLPMRVPISRMPAIRLRAIRRCSTMIWARAAGGFA